jgi:2-keto-4-pentenoate hydratase
VELHPRVHAALLVQLERREAALSAGARHVGWKIGGAIAEIDALTGGAPVVGYLTTATVVPAGGVHDASGAQELRAETELLIAGDRLGVALELVDVARPPGGMEAIVAGNVFHRALVLGATRSAAAGAQARLWIDGALRAAAPVSTDIAATLARVSALLATVGVRLQRGDHVLAGALTHVPVAAGQEIWAEIDGLGRVAVTIAP